MLGATMSNGQRLTIWCNFNFNDDARAELAEGLAESASVAFVRRGEPPDTQPTLRDADIVFGNPDPAELITALRVKWVQISTAGYTKYDRADLRDALSARGAIFTNSSNVYADPCAEHVLSFMLAMSRQLPAAIELQRQRRWDHHALRPNVRVLEGDEVLIVGYGAIGARLAELLEPFRVKMTGFRRKPRGDERINVRPMEALDEFLPTADHVVNLLPSAKGVERFFSGDRFGRTRRGAKFYNVGRGDTVDQAALRQALESGRLAGAYLDVTSPEPLPPDDPLWHAPNCWITPHIAGGAQGEQHRIVRHFLANFARFTRSEPLLNRIY
jgi:phosphoglycerate dehydrogenase-like enzyme